MKEILLSLFTLIISLFFVVLFIALVSEMIKADAPIIYMGRNERIKKLLTHFNIFKNSFWNNNHMRSRLCHKDGTSFGKCFYPNSNLYRRYWARMDLMPKKLRNLGETGLKSGKNEAQEKE